LPAEANPAPLWLPDLPGPGAEWSLERDDAHYVARVCRAAVGEKLEATDGAGTRASLKVLAVRGEVRVRMESSRREAAPARVTVACGAPEQDRADWLVEKLAELGVTEFQPLDCARARWERFDSRRERFGRLAIAALRQSRRAWRLAILDPVEPAAWLAGLAPEGRRWLADPGGGEVGLPDLGGPQAAAVGPSPGFSDPERQLFADAGFQSVRLSAGRLRTETAAVAWASLRGAGEAGTTPSP